MSDDKNPSTDMEESEASSDGSVRAVRYEYSPDLPGILTHINASILITTYQAGKLLVLGAHEGKLKISFLDYDQPMGVAVRNDRIALGTRRQIHFLVPAHETLGPPSTTRINDGCYVPRSSFYTGSIHGHDLAWGNDGLWVVNTLFSCLTTLHEAYSFIPQWRPKFISQLIDQDRCHLNGLAMENGQPKYVTAMAESNEAAGWRPTKATSGVVIDVPSGETISRDYSMPHSPRIHQGKLWLLNSGCGTFGHVDRATGKYESVESVPGYSRGLAFRGQFAFVGLSKIRETSVFGGVPIAEKRNELQCGLGVIDLVSGRTVAIFKFLSGVSEIFAVDVIPDFVNPMIAGGSVDRQEREVWIVPAESMARPKIQPQWPLFSAQRGSLAVSSEGSVSENSEQCVAKSQQLRAAGNFEGAAEQLEQAIVATLREASFQRGASPNIIRHSAVRRAALLVDLGNLRQDQSRQESATLCYQRAIEVDSTCSAALQNLGYLLFNQGETEKAVEIYQRLLAFDSSPLNQLLASSVLPIIYDSQNDIHDWRARQHRFLQALVDSNSTVDASKSLVPTCFLAAYQGFNDRDIMRLRGRVIQGRDFVANRKASVRTDGRKRIGFISAYFRDHTIGRLNLPRLRHVDRNRFHVTVVLAAQHLDSVSKEFQSAADDFVLLPRALPQAIERLQQLDLDALVHADVGMDSLCSTLAFSRFAPVQAVTWGHPDTTGSSMIDYFLSSRDLEAENADDHYTERLIRMPSLATLYDRPVRSESPMTRKAFGLPDDRNIYLCPQTLFKFHPEFDEALVSILKEDPHGILVLLEGRVSDWTHRLRTRMRRHLPDFDHRVRFVPAMPREAFLDLLAIADVALDPFHFGGGNSSIEAVAVGAPTVTYPGEFLRSRITQAIYKQIGMEQLVAHSPSEYVELSVSIATNPSRRNSLSRQLIEQSASLFENPSAMQDWNNVLEALCHQLP
ncbi:MAG: TIGR03032 family protein [Pirellulaceae bacterium]|nr:TIGR03032 family protein [Pirellulaceae bacterium]